MSETDAAAADGPVSLRLAVLGLWIEAVALAGFAVFQGVEVFLAAPKNPGISAILAVVTAVLAVSMYRLGFLLTKRRAWPRAAAIVLQLMALPVAFFMLTGAGNWILVQIAGLVIGVYCLGCAGSLLAPASRLALR
ncbi:MAG: hypothetical protein ACRDQZ_23240 [Mycobacteriales bacterium]